MWLELFEKNVGVEFYYFAWKKIVFLLELINLVILFPEVLFDWEW